MNTKKVWLVTGASKGLGLSLVKKLLNEGYQVAATSRTVESLEKEVGTSANFLPLEVNVTDETNVSKAIAKTIETFGGIDVVVNNAGYGQLGTLEELSDREARQNFDANVFGLLNVMRNVMPHLRNKKIRTHYQHFFHSRIFGCISGLGNLQRDKICCCRFDRSVFGRSNIAGN